MAHMLAQVAFDPARFGAGFGAVIVGSIVVLGVLATINLAHRALNIYRGSGLLVVIALLIGITYFMYVRIGNESVDSALYAGGFAGLGIAAIVLLARGRYYVPTAMRPPTPPPALESPPVDNGLLEADPFN